MHVSQELVPWLERTPQPVALATGRLVRSGGPAEELDACIKAAEVVARFIALVSLASSAATRPPDMDAPEVENFVGNLSFGVFEKAIRCSAAVAWDHPLRAQLRHCFRQRRAVAGQRLEEFVKLRNDLGHAITPADEARARALLELHDPIGGLMELLEDLQGILAYPLLVLLGQEHRRGRFRGRFALFSGEVEPIPQILELRDPLYEWECPYLCTPDGLIPLMPGLLCQPRADGRRGLYLLDGITEHELRYKGIQDGEKIVRSDGFTGIRQWLKLPFVVGETQLSYPLLERITCSDGRSLYGYLKGEEPSQAVPLGAESESRQQEWRSQTPRQTDEAAGVSSMREFEHFVNSLMLGVAYRDILYCLAAHDSLTELSNGTIRVVSASVPSRVLATIGVTAGKKLCVTIFGGALLSSDTQEKEVHELSPGESADDVVARIESLIRMSESRPLS